MPDQPHPGWRWYGDGPVSRTYTVHEAQDLRYKTEVIVKTATDKRQMHSSIQQTGCCVYYTDRREEGIIAEVIQRMEPEVGIW